MKWRACFLRKRASRLQVLGEGRGKTVSLVPMSAFLLGMTTLARPAVGQTRSTGIMFPKRSRCSHSIPGRPRGLQFCVFGFETGPESPRFLSFLDMRIALNALNAEKFVLVRVKLLNA